jgi:transposase
MPRPHPLPVRETIFRLWQQGQTAPQIAATLRLPGSTVYRFIHRFRRDGSAAIPPTYRHRADDVTPPDAVRAALDLRREHPTWGAGLIRVQLLLGAPDRPVPTERTLQRWFARNELSPAPAGRKPRAEAGRAASPHDTWQMDAKERIKLKNTTTRDRARNQ